MNQEKRPDLASILVVEDDDVDRESVHRTLGDSYHLIDAVGGIEGMEKAARLRPSCALIDYCLPDVDGLEVIADLVASGIPVIMMTGAGSERTAVRALKAGATDYITKDDSSLIVLPEIIRNAIRKADAQRRLVEQREELQNFISVASHDMRAPLRHIVSFANYAIEDMEAGDLEAVNEYLGHISDAGSRMISLLGSLEQFARSGRSDTELVPVNLQEVVALATKHLSVEIGKTKAEVSCATLPWVWGHEPSLIELLQNLIANAIKYSGDQTPRIEISCEIRDSTVTVKIRDNGVGIPEEFLQAVFAPFRRLHSYQAIKGSGIGLASCGRIVKHHRGEIWAESQVGNGSTFFFTLNHFLAESPCVGEFKAIE